MHVALVENREDHVHHKDREGHQDRQTGNGGAESLCFTLHLGAHARRHDLRGGFVDEVCRVAERYSGLEIEEERNTSELVQMIYCLWTDRLLPCDQLAEWHLALSVVGLDVE